MRCRRGTARVRMLVRSCSRIAAGPRADHRSAVSAIIVLMRKAASSQLTDGLSGRQGWHPSHVGSDILDRPTGARDGAAH